MLLLALLIPNTNEPVFVYGTLKKGHNLHHLLNDAKFIGEVRTEDEYTLYDVGKYPAMTEGKHSVVGELYLVNRATLRRLDRAEGTPYLYKRKRIKLKNAPHKEVWAYIFNRSTKNLEEIGEKWPKP